MDYQGLALANEFQIDELFSLHYFEYMNSFYFPGESHPFWEFVCVDKGEVTIGAGDRSFVLTRGQIVFHRPDEFHWVRAGGKAAPNLIVISFSTGSPLMDFFSERILQITEQDRLLLARIISEARLFLEGRLDDPYQKVLIPRKNAPAGSAQIIRTCLEQFLIGMGVKEPAQCRVHQGPHIGGGACLLFGEQERHPQAEPALLGKPDVHRHRLADYPRHLLERPQPAGIRRQSPGQKGGLFAGGSQAERQLVGGLLFLGLLDRAQQHLNLPLFTLQIPEGSLKRWAHGHSPPKKNWTSGSSLPWKDTVANRHGAWGKVRLETICALGTTIMYFRSSWGWSSRVKCCSPS